MRKIFINENLKGNELNELLSYRVYRLDTYIQNKSHEKLIHDFCIFNLNKKTLFFHYISCAILFNSSDIDVSSSTLAVISSLAAACS